MNSIKLIFFLSLILLLTGCTTSNKIINKSYNGEYRAEVKCDNTETGSSSTYFLRVKAVDNKLEKICWINGGYKDVSHFKPSTIGKNGYSEFTSDKGYKYEVRIKGQALLSKTGSFSEEDVDEENSSNYYYYSDDEDWDEYPFIE